MKQKKLLPLIFLLLGLFLGGIFTQSNTSPTRSKHAPDVAGSKTTRTEKTTVTVIKVIDGDTIAVLQNGAELKIRIIGINTPESVDPRRGVQCFGKEAATIAKEQLLNREVLLESDPSQDAQDKYGRLLRFVWIDDNTDFGAWMIENGYAYEYTYDTPHKNQEKYRTLQQTAAQEKKGLWAETTCQGIINQTKENSQRVSKKTCADFSTQQEAQAYFEAQGGGNSLTVKAMDGNDDGQACETLP